MTSLEEATNEIRDGDELEMYMLELLLEPDKYPRWFIPRVKEHLLVVLSTHFFEKNFTILEATMVSRTLLLTSYFERRSQGNKKGYGLKDLIHYLLLCLASDGYLTALDSLRFSLDIKGYYKAIEIRDRMKRRTYEF